MKFSLNIYINQILLLLFSAMAIFTPLYFYKKMVILLIIFLLWFFSTLSIDRNWWKDSIKILFILCSIIILDYISGSFQNNSTVTLLGINKMPTFVWILVLLFYKRHLNLFKQVLPFIILLITISIIFTLIGNIHNPGASRLLASSENDIYMDMRNFYRILNIGGYDFIYALVFLILPIGVLSKSNSYLTKIIIFSFIILTYITIIFGAYMIGILMSTIMVLLLFINPIKLGLKTIVFTILGLIIFKYFILDLLTSVGEIYDITSLTKHTEEISEIKYSEGDQYNNRFVIYYNAILNWLESPIWGQLFGYEYTRRTGHSQLLDFLEKYGFLSIVYFSYLLYLYKSVAKNIKDKIVKRYYIYYFVLIIVFMLINRFDTFTGLGFVLFFFGPIIILLSDKQINNNLLQI